MCTDQQDLYLCFLKIDRGYRSKISRTSCGQINVICTFVFSRFGRIDLIDLGALGSLFGCSWDRALLGILGAFRFLGLVALGHWGVSLLGPS